MILNKFKEDEKNKVEGDSVLYIPANFDVAYETLNQINQCNQQIDLMNKLNPESFEQFDGEKMRVKQNELKGKSCWSRLTTQSSSCLPEVCWIEY